MRLNVDFNQAKQDFHVSFLNSGSIESMFEPYDGPYSATPLTTAQIFETGNQVMTSDFIVDSIGSYNDLNDKPSINNVTLIGDKSLSDIGAQAEGEYADSALTNLEIEDLLNRFI